MRPPPSRMCALSDAPQSTAWEGLRVWWLSLALLLGSQICLPPAVPSAGAGSLEVVSSMPYVSSHADSPWLTGTCGPLGTGPTCLLQTPPRPVARLNARLGSQGPGELSACPSGWGLIPRVSLTYSGSTVSPHLLLLPHSFAASGVQVQVHVGKAEVWAQGPPASPETWGPTQTGTASPARKGGATRL